MPTRRHSTLTLDTHTRHSHSRRENVERLSLVDAVQGLLILHAPNPTRGRPFSPESAQPNQEFSLYPNSTIKWNPHGTGWMYNSFKLPMFALDAKNSPDVLEVSISISIRCTPLEYLA